MMHSAGHSPPSTGTIACLHFLNRGLGNASDVKVLLDFLTHGDSVRRPAVASFPTRACLAVVHATPLNIFNRCDESIQLYDNAATETIGAGGSTIRTLVSGFNGMFRNGVGSQATLAEFSITGGYIWYDISIIPAGSTGPGKCGSLGECKAVTGGTGFNTAMQISPSECTTVTCMADGCTDAYHYPSDGSKTHSCSDTATIDLIFCPGTPTSAARTTAPTTAAPSPVPTTSALKTTAPTSAPTAAPTPYPITARPQFTAPEPTETAELAATETTESVVISSSSFSTAGCVNSSSSRSLHEISVEDTAMSVNPEMESTSTPSTRGSSGTRNDQKVSTQSKESNTSNSTYVVSVFGVFVVVIALAAMVIVPRKKQQLEAMELLELVHYHYRGDTCITSMYHFDTCTVHS
ncbi:hypothetical protein PC112_g12156 [Phytophthora cactorum]|nr:hypothetical protein PC112_g12156 [Phytophthora cactorum]